MKRTKVREALLSWTALNDVLTQADEKTCNQLLREEIKGCRRCAFVKRIHARLNKVRAHRERTELEEMCDAQANND